MSGKHVLVLGATGPTGLIFSEKALAAGHILTLYVRTPSKLPDAIAKHANVTVIKGTLEDVKGLEKAASCDATVFVSFAGPAFRHKGTPVADGLSRILPLLIKNNFQRAFIISTPSFTVPQDKLSLKWRALIWSARLLSRWAIKEVIAVGEVTSKQPLEALRWTIFRSPHLMNGDKTDVKATFIGSGEDGVFLNRGGMAAWVLVQVEKDLPDEEWVGQAPMLCNA